MVETRQREIRFAAEPASQLSRYAELMILCARIGFNP